jgi:osmotically-inducible protein OsmY
MRNQRTLSLRTLSTLLLTTLALLFALPAMATAESGSDSTSLDAKVSDAMRELQVKTALLEKIGWDMLTVDVEVHGAHVDLNGVADNDANRALAKEVALSIEGVEKVSNHLTVEKQPTDAPVGDAVAKAEHEVNDALLESRVKTQLIRELGWNAFDIEVEAENGKVSLRGDLSSQAHETLALDTTKSCRGVDSVIDLLSVKTAS